MSYFSPTVTTQTPAGHRGYSRCEGHFIHIQEPIDRTRRMFLEESCTDTDLIYIQTYDDNVLYQGSKPPETSFLSNIDKDPTKTPSAFSDVETLHRPSTSSFKTVKTDGSSAFSSSSSRSRSGSSLFQVPSRSSTVATQYSLPAIVVPTPIPQTNTFVDELVPGVSSTVQTPSTIILVGGKQEQYVYPSPRGNKNKGGLWGWLKRWRRKQELDFEVRYEIWAKCRKTARREP